MVGHTEVHTSSRKVTATALPRKLARVTGCPYWSMRSNDRSRASVACGAPLMRWARIGPA